ncbi:low affinity iron permease family protein [Roseiterribacter gracilis]|uniref:Membrane protein n=1 Tax=Roseiterribacter gracilis TaxID=2812848 RepID=A0A8S8X6E2_9PROT|nr:membrane protein [Rhodospirillales bacterium TMPK1]
MKKLFHQFAAWTARASGRPSAFLLAVLIVVVWGATGPIFHYSDTWQLVINTGTTIITFLMVFLIQNTQDRDTCAIHLKLDELISVNRRARNSLLNLEDLTSEELEELRDKFRSMAAKGDPVSSVDAALVEQEQEERDEERRG